MYLSEYLNNTSHRNLSEIAHQHQIYYSKKFSKSWVINKINQKLLDSNYLKKIINNKLSSKTIFTLKKLISTESINKQSMNPDIYNDLKKLGFIFEKNNFCYLPCDLKEELSFLTTKSKEESNSLTSDVTVNEGINLSFFTYLILSLSYAIKLNRRHLISYSALKKELLNYINQINLTNLSNRMLLDLILEYSSKNKLILVSSFKLTDSFKTWLTKPYQEKLISALNIFFPNNTKILRQIIATLIYYPFGQKIPINFLYQELNLTKLNSKEKELLRTLNIFNINNNELYLTSFCWNLFNCNSMNFEKPQNITSERVVLNLNPQLPTLWTVCQYASLIKINDKLEFKLDKNNYKLNKDLEQKYPDLKKIRLQRIKGKNKKLSQEKWHQILQNFKNNHEISKTENLRISLSYPTLTV